MLGFDSVVNGRQAFEELETLLKNKTVCIAEKMKLTKDSGVASEDAYNEIVQGLLKKSRAKGKCLLFFFSFLSVH